jgi:hypothetical protein
VEQLPRERGVSVNDAAKGAWGLSIRLQLLRLRLRLRLKAQPQASMKRVYLLAVTCDVLRRMMHVAFGRCADAVLATSANQPVLAHALSVLCTVQC